MLLSAAELRKTSDIIDAEEKELAKVAEAVRVQQAASEAARGALRAPAVRERSPAIIGDKPWRRARVKDLTCIRRTVAGGCRGQQLTWHA